MAALRIVLLVAYPLLIYVALQKLEPRHVALSVIALLVLRAAFGAEGSLAATARAVWLPVVAVVVAAGATILWNDPLGLLLTPVAVSLALLVTFLNSLRTGVPIVERLARLRNDDLGSEEVGYCRAVTRVWCGFFVVNGGVALCLALSGWLEAWTLYTGLLAYVAMGVLFAFEYVYRHWRFRRYVGAFTDPILQRIFPPRNEGPASDVLPSDLEAGS